jgi:hypothetical protein
MTKKQSLKFYFKIQTGFQETLMNVLKNLVKLKIFSILIELFRMQKNVTEFYRVFRIEFSVIDLVKIF